MTSEDIKHQFIIIKWRWTSWASVPNKPTVSVDVKQLFCQGQGSELRSCLKVEVDVLGSRPYSVSVDVKQHFNNNMMMMWDLMSSDVGLTY